MDKYFVYGNLPPRIQNVRVIPLGNNEK